MIDVEHSTDPRLVGNGFPERCWTDTGTYAGTVMRNAGRRGGWLCDEVGMGKTLVAISLVLANPRGGVPSAAGETTQPLTLWP